MNVVIERFQLIQMKPGIGQNMLCAVGDFVSGFSLETYFQRVHGTIGRYETPG